MSTLLSWSYLMQRPRIWKYKLLSNNRRITGKPIYNQPALLIGDGSISFGNNVQLGFFPSPSYYNGYIHLESRTKESSITIGNNVYFNNNFFAISESAGIEIGNDTLIGLNCEILDSDFHELSTDKRFSGKPISKKVKLGNNVFLGNNVKIGKGVELGDNVIVANSSVVVNSFGSNVIIGGIPAKILGRI